MRGIFVHFHNPISLSEYYWINTLVYGHAVPEFHAFVERPNLLIWDLSVSVSLNFLQKNHHFNLFHYPIKGKFVFLFIFVDQTLMYAEIMLTLQLYNSA